MVLKRHRAGKDFSLILPGREQSQPAFLEAARKIRTELPKDRPVMLLFAFDWNEIREEALSAGMNGHMAKPLDFETLACEISKYLQEPAE